MPFCVGLTGGIGSGKSAAAEMFKALGAAVGIGLIVFAKHAREKPIPFGPYLAAAGLIAMLWGERINKQYLDLF